MFFKNIKLREKLFIIIFSVILIPTISVSSIIYSKSKKAISNQTSETITSSISFTIKNIDTVLRNIQYSSITALYDNSFNKRLLSIVKDNTKFDEYTAFTEYTYLRNIFTTLLYQTKDIYSYNIYLLNQNAIISTKSNYFLNVDDKIISFIEKQKRGEISGKWFISRPVEEELDSYSKNYDYPWLLTFTNLIKDGENTLGVLAMNVDEKFIENSFDEILIDSRIDSVILDNNSNIISYRDKNYIGMKINKYTDISDKIDKNSKKNGSFTYKFDEGSYLVIFGKSTYNDWKYIKIIPENYILGELTDINNFLFFVLIITALIIFTITYFLSYIFYKPIKKLVEAMKMIQFKDFSVRIEDPRTDEYQMVYQGFNNMVVELIRLMDNLTNEKLLNKEAEIKYLQAQINPHFLYNTLESIYSIAELYHVEEISEIVAALSKFFRISLSGGKNIITLRDAINLTKSYLTIQSVRIRGRISYEINVPENLLECKVPKLILQLLVENSIFHGIEKKKGKGHVEIIGYSRGNILELLVKDDGIGIKHAELIQLQNSINGRNFKDTPNFALKNLNQQIKLKYGEDCGLSVSSEFGKGTNVSIILKTEFLL